MPRIPDHHVLRDVPNRGDVAPVASVEMKGVLTSFMDGRSGATSIGCAICHGLHVSIAAAGEIFSMASGRGGRRVGRLVANWPSSHVYGAQRASIGPAARNRGKLRIRRIGVTCFLTPRAISGSRFLASARFRMHQFPYDHCTPTHRYQAWEKWEKERNEAQPRASRALKKIAGRQISRDSILRILPSGEGKEVKPGWDWLNGSHLVSSGERVKDNK